MSGAAMSDKRVELLPCPFCGCADPWTGASPNSLPPAYTVFCSDVICMATVEGRTARRAALVWNRREMTLTAVTTPDLAERLAVAEERARVLGNMLDPVLDQLTVANKRLQALTKVAEPFARFNGSENPMRPEINALRGMIANLSSGTPTNRKYREARMAGAEALAKYDAGEGK